MRIGEPLDAGGEPLCNSLGGLLPGHLEWVELVGGVCEGDDAGGGSFELLAPCVSSLSSCAESLSLRIDSSSPSNVSTPCVFQRQSPLFSLGAFGGICICGN